MSKKALYYFMHYGPSAFRFELAGNLDGESAHQLERDWRRAFSTIGARALVVDLTFVTGAEEEGRTLLARWYATGARFIAESGVSRKLAEAITGKPLPASAISGYANAAQTWQPFRTSLSAAGA